MDSRQYDTVAFDVRDDAKMLFFAKTTASGDIAEYLLLMRTADADSDTSHPIYIEINEEEFGGHDLISEASLTGNILTLTLRQPADELGGISEIVLTWTETSDNIDSIEAGAFTVIGDTLACGNA